MTDLYKITKVAAVATEWRETDKQQTAASAALKNLSAKDRSLADRYIEQKDRAVGVHLRSVRKLRAAVDELAKKGGQP